MSGINQKQVHGAGYCDEIVNNALMEIATDKAPVFQCLQANGRIDFCNQWVAG